MNDACDQRAVFVTLVRSSRERANARVLTDSIRAFAGDLRHCPIWVFATKGAIESCVGLESEDIDVFPLELSDTVGHYPYSDKVHACAQAERMADQAVRSLIWMAPECLVINPPILLRLGDPSTVGGMADVAVRPVHITNVGIPPGEPLDPFWKGACEAVGIEDVETTVETFVDAKRIRAYYNSHILSANPIVGLFGRWQDVFDRLVTDRAFQKNACQDAKHQVFLHQAALSVVLAAFNAGRIRILPPEYSYPYNLQQSVPEDRRVGRLNDVVCIAYDERSLDPRVVDDIAIDEPLRGWLSDHLALRESLR